MIYTVTLNPSIDLIVEVSHFQLNQLNRIERESKFPGGKGINVSRVLNTMGVPSVALGYIGGFTGVYIQNALESEGIQTDFVNVQEDSRINIKLKTANETEINGQGPALTEQNRRDLYKKLESLQAGDILILAGSIPPSLPKSFYCDIMEKYRIRGVKVVVDAGGKVLADVLQQKPFLVKPNHHELSDLFGVAIYTMDDIIPYGKKLLAMGAEHVIVSMAGDGALLFTNNEVYKATVPQGDVVNSVGAGDSLVAGFIGTYVKKQDLRKALQVAVATGSATAFSKDLASKDMIDFLMDQVAIKKI